MDWQGGRACVLRLGSTFRMLISTAMQNKGSERFAVVFLPSPPVLRGRGVGGEGAAPSPTLGAWRFPPHWRPSPPEYRGRGEKGTVRTLYSGALYLAFELHLSSHDDQERPATHFQPANGVLRLLERNSAGSIVQDASGSMTVTSASAPGLQRAAVDAEDVRGVDRQFLDELRPGQDGPARSAL